MNVAGPKRGMMFEHQDGGNNGCCSDNFPQARTASRNSCSHPPIGPRRVSPLGLEDSSNYRLAGADR